MKDILIAVTESDAQYPIRNNPTDAGIDLKSYFDYIIHEGETKILRTGVAVLIPEGYMGLIMPKSRSDYLIGGGVVDAGYTGEIKVKIVNTSGHTLGIAYSQEIAQLIVVPVEIPELKYVNYNHLEREGKKISERGTAGGINESWDGLDNTLRRGF